MPIDLLSSFEDFGGAHSVPVVSDLPFTPAPWSTARPRRLHTLLSSFTEGGAAPAEGGEGKAEAKEEKAAPNCEELLDYQLENGKEVQLCGDSEEGCIESCKNADELKDQNLEEGGGNKGMVALNMATGGEQQMMAGCTRFCRLEFELFCFPGDSTVVVRDRGRVPLADIQIGDDVMVMRGTPAQGDVTLTFEPVIAWLHFDPYDTAPVLHFRHSIGKLHTSPGHLVFSRRPGSEGVPSTKMAPILARDIRLGDRLLAPWIDGTLAEPEVLEIGKVSKKGLYAPLVESGTLLVDGTAVSCYALPTDISENPFYSKVFSHIAGTLGREGIHDAAHTLFLPFRLWSSALPALPSSASLPRCLSEEAAVPEDREFFEFATAKKRVPSPILPYAWFFYVVFKSFVT
mmetsp:Transcript_67077/g.119363  ORF Transcript_67077/g.119363 Transcript_67077/m.119363 type:complete len:402 (+) Transcript_67077:125-1330(+)